MDIQKKTSRHIGIVACSYEGAALCYKTICNEGADLMGEHAHPETSLHTHPLSDYMQHIYRRNWSGVAELMISSARKLVAAGAEILVCPDNTIHQVFPEVVENIKTPWLHIADMVLEESRRMNYGVLAVLGTKYLMEGPVYREKCSDAGLGFQIPDEKQRQRINDIIFDELVYGRIEEASKTYLLEIIAEHREKGCDAVVLGCTELPLIILPGESQLPVLDSTRILARAVLKQALKNNTD